MAFDVNRDTLAQNEFTHCAGARYYGAGRDRTHPSTCGPTVILLTAVSIKINDQGGGNLPDLQNGKFDVTYRADRWGTWGNSFSSRSSELALAGRASFLTR